MSRTAIYIRVASRDPDDQRANRSRQSKICHAVARRLRSPEVWEYADLATSGLTIDRPQLQRLLRDVRSRRVTAVITQDPARLSRSTIDSIQLTRLFQQAGVTVYFANELQISTTPDPTGPNDPADTPAIDPNPRRERLGVVTYPTTPWRPPR